jgi:hypothetical protein
MSGKYGTRSQLVAHLTENGFVTSNSQMNKWCMPSCDEGPKPAFWWGRRPIYDLDEGLVWARARARPTRPSAVRREGDRSRDRPPETSDNRLESLGDDTEAARDAKRSSVA